MRRQIFVFLLSTLLLTLTAISGLAQDEQPVLEPVDRSTFLDESYENILIEGDLTFETQNYTLEFSAENQTLAVTRKWAPENEGFTISLREELLHRETDELFLLTLWGSPVLDTFWIEHYSSYKHTAESNWANSAGFYPISLLSEDDQFNGIWIQHPDIVDNFPIPLQPVFDCAGFLYGYIHSYRLWALRLLNSTTLITLRGEPSVQFNFILDMDQRYGEYDENLYNSEAYSYVNGWVQDINDPGLYEDGSEELIVQHEFYTVEQVEAGLPNVCALQNEQPVEEPIVMIIDDWTYLLPEGSFPESMVLD